MAIMTPRAQTAIDPLDCAYTVPLCQHSLCQTTLLVQESAASGSLLDRFTRILRCRRRLNVKLGVTFCLASHRRRKLSDIHKLPFLCRRSIYLATIRIFHPSSMKQFSTVINAKSLTMLARNASTQLHAWSGSLSPMATPKYVKSGLE